MGGLLLLNSSPSPGSQHTLRDPAIAIADADADGSMQSGGFGSATSATHAAHCGYVASLDFHPEPRALTSTTTSAHPATPGGQPRLSELLISSAADGDVRIWTPRDAAAGGRATACVIQTGAEAICDARWAPRHPSLFATADSRGHASLYDIGAHLGDLGPTNSPSAESPAPVGSVALGGGDQPAACTLVRWAEADGASLVLAGDTAGRVHLVRVSDDLGAISSCG